MRHPSEYTTTNFHGLHVMVVDSGTSIRDERTGQEETVTDHGAVFKGSILYCTQSAFDALKARIQ